MSELDFMRKIPVMDAFDVVVAGGGPSGVCAAVSSARSGARTALLERYGILGGNMTSAHVGPFMGHPGEGTMAMEINRLAGTRLPIGRVAHNFEMLKTALPEWVAAAGVEIFLQAPVVDTITEENTMRGVVVGTPNGLRVLKGKVVIDATGNGTVSYLAGADSEKGRESDGLMQPVTLMFTVAGVDDSAAITGGNPTYDVRMPGSGFREQCETASRSGLLPRFASFVRLYRSYRKGECVINATQSNFIDGTELPDITRAEIDLRKQITDIVEFLKGHVKGFENCYLIDSADTLGVRETRRITGEYVLEEEDLRSGKKFEDVIVHNARFILDIHSIKSGGQDNESQVEPYDIPYRCLVPKRIENLLTVGRCISGTHVAHSSYRVMNIAMAIGQAGGIAAALSAGEGVSPRELDYKKVQQRLMDTGVKLFD